MYNKHKHRIIPGHVGGKYTANNIVILTISEHAEAHKKLYEEHGREEDRLAWLGLSGQIDKEEIIWRSKSLGGKKNKGKKYPPRTKEHIQNLSKSLQGIPSSNKGKKASEITRQKISKFQKTRIHSDQQNKNHSLRMKGTNNPFYGKSHSEETKRKISETMRNRKANANNL